jgi:hypothetical protein
VDLLRVHAAVPGVEVRQQRHEPQVVHLRRALQLPVATPVQAMQRELHWDSQSGPCLALARNARPGNTPLIPCKHVEFI